MRDLAEFRSRDFEPFLPDERQVNPEVYGAELAFWLARSLAERGVVTSYPGGEDWGWYLDFETAEGAKFAIHCANVGDDPRVWRLSLRRFGRKWFGRDKPPYSDAGALVTAVQQVLEAHAGIDHLDWLYPDEHAP